MGSDDDYIYVDHSNDEVQSEELTDDFDLDDYVTKEPKAAKDDSGSDEFIHADHSYEESSEADIDGVHKEENVDFGTEDDYIHEGHSDDEELREDDIDGVHEEEKVDLGSDDDYIYVDHSHDEEHVLDDEEEKFNGSADEDAQIDKQFNKRPKRTNFVKSIISEVLDGESRLQKEEVETLHGEIIEEDEVQQYRPAPNDDSVVEAEIVDDDLNIFTDHFGDEDIDFERPSPKRDYTEGEELNIFTDHFGDEEIPDDPLNIVANAKRDYIDEVFDNPDLINEISRDNHESPVGQTFDDNDFAGKSAQDSHVVPESPDDGSVNDDGSDVVGESRENVGFADASPEVGELFEGSDFANEIKDEILNDDGPAVEDAQPVSETPEKESYMPTSKDGVTYFQGASDVTNPLRKNNVYYKNEHRNKSLRESLKGIKKDMEYINKSLNEIENPTEIDYVSVVDRTEEYDPADYLNMPSDDDSDKILEMERGLTFAEREEKRIERELSQNEDVIVPVHEQFRNEELRDQALEDIILSANEDYKEIEKQRHKKDNQLKAFDDQKLPGKRKIEDEIVDYVEITDIGLHSSDDLYNQPIGNVAKSVSRIVDVEGPIHVSEVTRRIKDSCEVKRAGSKLKKRVNEAIGEAEKSGDIIRIGDFLYDASNNNVVIRKRIKPNIDMISDEEIAKNIETVLLHRNNVTTSQVAKETSRNFGFRSTSKKTATRINSVLDLMIANNKVKIENDIVELK